MSLRSCATHTQGATWHAEWALLAAVGALYVLFKLQTSTSKSTTRAAKRTYQPTGTVIYEYVSKSSDTADGFATNSPSQCRPQSWRLNKAGRPIDAVTGRFLSYERAKALGWVDTRPSTTPFERATKAKSTSEPVPDWNAFQRATKGCGLSRRDAALLWAKRKATTASS